MKKNLLAPWALSAALLLGAGLASTGALAQTYTKQQLQDTYTAYLTTEGYKPDITQAGNVRFRREGRTFVIFADEKDPTYFRMVFAIAESDKSKEARIKRLEACNVASGEVKVIKAYLDDDGDPNFSAEMFLVVPGDFKTTLNRLLRAIDNAYDKYSKKVADQR